MIQGEPAHHGEAEERWMVLKEGVKMEKKARGDPIQWLPKSCGTSDGVASFVAQRLNRLKIGGAFGGV